MKNISLASSGFKAVGLLAAASLGALATSLEADAALLFSDTDSFTNVLTELTGAPDLVVDKFDGTGFDVTSVVVTLTASLRSEGTLTNTAAQAQTFRFRTEAELFEVTPGTGAPASLTTLTPFFEDVISSRQYMNVAPGASVRFGPATINGSDTDTYTDGDIAGFLGGGTITLDPFTLISTTFVGGGGNVANAVQTFASASLTIEYFGEQLPPPSPTTPEPSAMVGLGLIAGLGVLAKRKKA